MKIKKYQLYKVRFLDHAVGIDKEITIEAVGFFIKSTRHSYIFSHWLVEHEDISVVLGNLEPFVILKSAIISIRLLKMELAR